MTTDPSQATQAIGELENGRYHRLLERVADILEMKLERNETDAEPSIRIWRNPQSASPFADFTLSTEKASTFLYGLAVGIQGDWAP